MIRLDINSEFHLSPPLESDIPRYVEFFQDKTIHDNTLTIPYPYTIADAQKFMAMCRESEQKAGEILQFAIRNSQRELVGGIGFHGKNVFEANKHKDEIGYWLAAPLRGKGIMSAVVNFIVDYGRNERKLTRFEAPVYVGNLASEKTLLKCGFSEEGIMKKAYFKNGVFIDGKMMAKIF